MTAELRRKALERLRGGNVCIFEAIRGGRSHGFKPVEVHAAVRSTRPGVDRVYIVDYVEFAGPWSCTCRRYGSDVDAGECAHILAVQLVTGHAPPAP